MSPIRTFAVGVAAAVVVVLTSVAPAFAHDELSSSTPAAGARLEAPPASVSLEFSADVMNVGALIVVADASGKDWVAGDPVVQLTTVTVPVSAGMPEGAYEIRWRVVSSDGHPVAGTIPFTVGDAAPLARPSATAGGAAVSDPGEGVAQTQESGQNAQDDGGALRVVLVGAAGAAIAAALFVVIILLRRRPTPRDTDGPGR